VSEQPTWGMTDYGTVMHLTGEPVGIRLGLYYARCQVPTAYANPYLLSTFLRPKGIKAMRASGYVCKRCQWLFEQGVDIL
jgi:hypothetical protein